MTRGRRFTGATATATSNRTYVVCLACGKEFAYDWKTMSVGQPVELTPTTAAAEPLYRQM
jgi:hypothetical protein